jgi:hypothetical protein
MSTTSGRVRRAAATLGPDAVVDHLHRQPTVRCGVDGDRGAGRAGVLDHVGERLLDDPVGGGLDHPGQPPVGWRAVAQRHGHPGGAGLRGEPGQIGQPGRRVSLRRPLPQQRDRGAQLRQRLAAGLPRLVQRPAGRLRVPVERRRRDTGLHVHRRDGVRHDVVHLAGDAQPLLPGPVGRLLLALGGQPGLPLGVLAPELPAAADDLPEQQRGDRPEQLGDGGAGPPVDVQAQQRRPGDHHRADPDRTPAVALDRHRVQPHGGRQVEQLAAVPEQGPGGQRGGAHQRDGHRGSAARLHRGERETEQRVGEAVGRPGARSAPPQVEPGHHRDGGRHHPVDDPRSCPPRHWTPSHQDHRTVGAAPRRTPAGVGPGKSGRTPS